MHRENPFENNDMHFSTIRTTEYNVLEWPFPFSSFIGNYLPCFVQTDVACISNSYYHALPSLCRRPTVTSTTNAHVLLKFIYTNFGWLTIIIKLPTEL